MIIEIECTINVMRWNHPETIPRSPLPTNPGAWKNSTKPVPGAGKVRDHCFKASNSKENPVG